MSFKKTTAFISSIVALLIFLGSIPTLWTALSTSLSSVTDSAIPLLSGMTGIIGLVFGAIVLMISINFLIKKRFEKGGSYDRSYQYETFGNYDKYR
jgi:divalent metal cation (Fe/Co/Zn/Cd) transporter